MTLPQNTTKYVIRMTGVQDGSVTLTIPNPKSGITKAETESLISAYNSTYGKDYALAYCGYVQQSYTWVYPTV